MGSSLCPITGEWIDKLMTHDTSLYEGREILIQVGEPQPAVLLGEARLGICTLQGSIYWTPMQAGWGEKERDPNRQGLSERRLGVLMLMVT